MKGPLYPCHSEDGGKTTVMTFKPLHGGATWASITHMFEGWSFNCDSLEVDRTTVRENALLYFQIGPEVKWQGTIQDFMAIKNIAQNALERICSDPDEPVEDVITELNQLLSHFK